MKKDVEDINARVQNIGTYLRPEWYTLRGIYQVPDTLMYEMINCQIRPFFSGRDVFPFFFLVRFYNFSCCLFCGVREHVVCSKNVGFLDEVYTAVLYRVTRRESTRGKKC